MMVIETERLLLRELTYKDFPVLFEILSDPETMRHYPQPFDEKYPEDVPAGLNGIFKIIKSTDLDCGPSF
jgi:RimJ/RimL family protein N-acetyltransferase